MLLITPYMKRRREMNTYFYFWTFFDNSIVKTESILLKVCALDFHCEAHHKKTGLFVKLHLLYRKLIILFIVPFNLNEIDIKIE